MDSSGVIADSDCDEGGRREDDEKNLTFLGLLLFSDPVRESAKEAIAICQKAGIEIKMLTGDHPVTAHAVAEKTGIIHSDEYLYVGNQLAQMPMKERILAYQSGAIFSRVLPEQKHEMVQALKQSGKVVAMTGDGINDAPALKLADIGISMGLSATDVARSTAQMILVKNDFKGLVEAVFEGRRIFENLPSTDGDMRQSLLPVKRLVRSAAAGVIVSLVALGIFGFYRLGGDIIRARSYAMMAVPAGNILFGFSPLSKVLHLGIS